jgi:uncharacterized protein YggE
MTTLATPRETFDERVDRLICSHRDEWPQVHSTTIHDAIAGLIARADVLEQAIQVMAVEIQRLSEKDEAPGPSTADG